MPLKANKKLREFSKKNNHRLVTMAFQTERGGELATEGCVLVSDANRVAELFLEVMSLMQKTDPKSEDGK